MWFLAMDKSRFCAWGFVVWCFDLVLGRISIGGLGEEIQMATAEQVIKCKGPCFLLLPHCLSLLFLCNLEGIVDLGCSWLFYSPLMNSSTDPVMLACNRGELAFF